MVRQFDEIDLLEAVLEIKRSKVSKNNSHFVFTYSMSYFTAKT